MVMLLTWLLVRGVRESARANTIIVIVKVGAILLFIFGAARSVDTHNWHPFMPNGYSGVLTGAAIVFFSYIGFDALSTAAEECHTPQRDLPRGIMFTLVICAILYAAVALVLTGIVHWDTLNNDAPVANALKAVGLNRLRFIVTVGALLGMLSGVLVSQYGQSRILFAMSRDRLLPGIFSRVHPTFKTPDISTWIAGIAVAIPAGVWDIGTFADLTNIGTLFAFIVVSAGVILLRRSQPDHARSFRVPWVPLLPLLSILCCLLLMLSLPLETWIRFFVWLAIGLAIYFSYSRRRVAEDFIRS
jgi:APA family basic amino acid/polyamine antiporter